MTVRIATIDTYLPTRVRRREDWPPEIVARWAERLSRIVPSGDQGVEVTEGVTRAQAAIGALRDDPFQGVSTVHVVGDDEDSSDLEATAARQVLERSGVAAEDVDLLLSHPMVPDYLCVNPASAVHDKLGLTPSTPAFGIDGVCTSFILQLDLARKAMLADDAERVLVTQSSACTRLMPPEQPFSPWFGDAGGAALLERAPEGHGLLATSTRTWGNLCRAFCATVPEGRWHDGGKVVAHNEDRVAARRMQLQAPDIGKDLIAETLDKAGVRHDEVSFFACHQPAAWFPEVCREHAGLTEATCLPTFEWTGNLSSVNLPMQLSVATREGVLKRGDLVVLFALASGMMAACGVMRWA